MTLQPDTAIDLDALQTVIADSIKAEFPDLQTVEFYRDDRKSLPVPACLLALLSLEPDPDVDPGTEQLACRASFEAQIVLGFRTPQAQREVRKLAAALGAHVHQRRWGQPVEPAQVVDISPDDFAPELDRYVVWRVEWQQVVHLGESVWTNDGTIPTEVLAAWAPEIGPEHEEDYEAVEGVDE